VAAVDGWHIESARFFKHFRAARFRLARLRRSVIGAQTFPSDPIQTARRSRSVIGAQGSAKNFYDGGAVLVALLKPGGIKRFLVTFFQKSNRLLA
jgi:hypothetical protein